MKITYHSAKFSGHKHSGSGDIMVFVCYMTLHDHVIKALFDFIAWISPQDKSPLPRLVAIDSVIVEI